MQYLENLAEKTYQKKIVDCSNQEIYYILLNFIKEKSKEKPRITGNKKLYYISAEFLVGKLLSNNLLNLGLFDEVSNYLQTQNKNLAEIEDYEPEPSLGNGGLGRLAACFLDSIATLGLCGDGIGLNYHFGLFKQTFKNNSQQEEINEWIEQQSWLQNTNIHFDVDFGKFSVRSKLYDVDVIGYENGVNKLHLFDIETVNEKIVSDGINFDKNNIKENLTLFLYPDDSDKEGKLLRVYQQYFMVSNAAQYILMEHQNNGHSLLDLDKYVKIQINDTHPAMIIPELIRLLVKNGIDFKKAVEITTNTCAYTNHTILSEALEKWPRDYLEEVVPHLLPIIEQLNSIVLKTSNANNVSIIDQNNNVHMANMAIHFGYSVNGVAQLHTDILKDTELNHFYKLYPEKFNNKTNGITFRRWLLSANPELTQLIDKLIGQGYKKDASLLKNLTRYIDDETVLSQLDAIKTLKKKQLADFLNTKQGIELDTKSIFDIQIKRLHEYKRQQLNLLYIIDKYLKIKQGQYPKRPITFIFGAKAAPAYTTAKDIIHLVLTLSKLIEQDDEVNRYIKLVMVENYNVTNAEKLIPACDISEQISLASKEASGTGNMKFMLNGALTLGTLDGANVEIEQLVGRENIYIFGETSDQVIQYYQNQSYNAETFYKDPAIKPLVDFIVSDQMLSIGNKEKLTRLRNNLVYNDYFMTLLDLKDYIATKEKMLDDYEDRKSWIRKSLINIANAGFFSSDRTIAEYNKDIWKLNE